jgi:hypothetical protein
MPYQEWTAEIFFFLRKSNLFAIYNNTFSKWWESVKDGL